MGIYDISAMITFITNMRSELLHTYIGHSMGATSFYITASKRPEIAQMVRMMINLAPAVYTNHMQSPIRYLVSYKKELQTLLPVIFSYFPAGASIKTTAHFAQIIESGEFRQYDYGRAKNLVIYNLVELPEYDLANITIPVALFYFDDDKLISSMDLKRLSHVLPNVMDLYQISESKFNHLDFLWANNAPQLVYEKISRL
ncbi:lipase 1-like [Nylanderia fulva]|uniref:lipase 1-like n=1 Tax=Nylanderia fulva TaxID=613905 RepID=UPI0010FAD9DA|nr:lipase 1-like [Nylanderia fulva]